MQMKRISSFLWTKKLTRFCSQAVGGLVLASALGFGPWAGPVLAQACQCMPPGPDATLLSGNSATWGPFEMLFDQKVAGRGVYLASLCATPAQEITQVKLWMPDMGHGSSPTTLELANGGCTRVSKVNFMMPGLWEIHLIYRDGSMALTSIEVP
jgi:hypothetical protein